MNSPSTAIPKPAERLRNTQMLKTPNATMPAKLDKFLFAQVAWCTIPALILVRMGEFIVGSLWCFMFLLVFTGRYMLKGNAPAAMALIVASMPALFFTRTFFFHNSTVFFLGLGLASWYIHAPTECGKLWGNPIIRLFFITGAVYWGISVLLTRHYAANLIVMEMLCSAGGIYLLARHPKYLATALGGWVISLVAIGIGVIGKGQRMGAASIDGEGVGSNIFIGFPAALGLLLIIADNGKLLLLQDSKIMKNVMIVICGTILLFSTSRTSWIVALLGILVIIFFQSKYRRKIFVGIFLAGCVLGGVLQTESGEKITQYFEMAFDSDRTMRQKTTGRADMWVLFPKVLADYPLGVGPGFSRQAYAQYSWVDPEVTFRAGREMAWHAIYMHVGVEIGLVGLTLLVGLLGMLLLRVFLYRKATGNFVPLLGMLGFLITSMSYVGMDALTGFYLGLAFLGTVIPSKEAPRSNRLKALDH